MSDDSQLKTQTPTGYKNAAARTLPGTDQIAAAIRNKAINLVPTLFKDLYETLKELGQHDELYKKEAKNIRWAARRVNVDTKEW